MARDCVQARGAADAVYVNKMSGSGVLSGGRNEDGERVDVYPLADTICGSCGCPTLYAIGTPKPRGCGLEDCKEEEDGPTG